MDTIDLKQIFHRGKECVGLYFDNNPALNNLVQKLTGVKWSQTNKCWYIPREPGWYNELKVLTKGKVTLTGSGLEDDKESASISNIVVRRSINKSISKVSSPLVEQQLSNVNRIALQQFIQQLQLKAYSASTIRTYRTEFLQLLKLLKSKPVNELTVGDIKRYMVYAMQQIGINEHTAHSRLNALKFYFEQVLGREKFFWEIPRPKKPLDLPRIFNQDEIAAIINGIKNKKHKAMLMLAYSGGLRVSEVVSIKTYDIDSKRMTIFIRQAKGKKDRVVSLSPVLLVMLREYALEYKPDKTGYLFEGNTKGTPYSTRSLQEVLQAAKNKAGIIKPGSIHSLRHSFATHLIDKGTDVTMIQRLLGHNDLKTTLRYLHTSNKDLLKIISPLDDLKLT